MRDAQVLLQRYGFALAATGLAFLFTLLLAPLSDRYPLVLFIAAVVVSALHGGLRPALAATLASTILLLARHWSAPPDSAALPESDFFLRLGMFVLVGVLAGFLSRECKRAIEAVTWLHDSLSILGDAVILTDAGARITYLNPAAQQLTGWNDDALDKPFQQVFRLVHEETGQAVEDPVAQVLRTAAITGMVQHAVLATSRAKEMPIDYRAAPLRDATGNLAGAFLVFRDISARWKADHELRQREEQFRSLAASAAAGVLVLDSAGRCTFANSSWQTAAGLTLEESLGQGWARSIHPDDREWLVTDWEAAVHREQPFAREVRLQTAQGDTGWFHLRSCPMLSDYEKVIGHVATLEDIGPRKQAEQALADNQALLRAVLETVPHATFVKDMQGHYVAINSTGARALGKTIEEIIGAEDAALVAPERARQLKESDRHVLATGQPQSGETVEKTAAGTRTCWSIRAPYRDRHGNLMGLIGLVQDVTERKQTEHALEELEQRFYAFLENIPGLAFLKDASGQYLYVNEAHAQISGDDRAEWTGRTDDELFPPALAQRFKEHDRQVWAGRQAAQVMEDVPQNDRMHHWLVHRFPILDRHGNPVLLGGIGLDVTQHRHVEEALRKTRDELDHHVQHRTSELVQANALLQEQVSEHRRAHQELREHHERSTGQLRQRTDFLQSILEQVPAAIVASEGDGAVSICSLAARSLLGWPQEGMPADPWMHMQARRPDGITQLTQDEIPLLRALEGETVRHTELVIAAGHGPARTLCAAEAPLWDAHGNRRGAAMVLHDVSEHRHAEEKLRHAIAEHRQVEARLHGELDEYRQREEKLRHDLTEHMRTEQRLRHELSEQEQAGHGLRQDLTHHHGVAEQLRQEIAGHGQLVLQLRHEITDHQHVEQRLRHELSEQQSAREHLQQQLAEQQRTQDQTRQELEGRLYAEEQLRREREFWERLIDCSGAGICAFDCEGRYTVWNRAMERLAGLDRATALGRMAPEVFPLFHETGADKALQTALTGTPLIARHGPFPAVHAGVPRFLEGNYAPLRGVAGAIVGGVGVFRDATDDQQAEEHQARLLEEQNARAAAELAQRRAAFLADAARTLASSLDYDIIVQNVPRVAVPFLADWCAVHGLEPDGSLRQLAASDASIRTTYRAWESGRRSTARVHAADVVSQVVRTSQSLFYPKVVGASSTRETVPNGWSSPGRPEPESGMCVPLIVRGETIGAISFETVTPGRHHGPEDLDVAEEFVRHAGAALEKACLYQEARTAQDRLRLQLHSINALAGRLQDGVCAMDRSGILIFVNAAAERLLGWKESEVLGKNIHETIYLLPSQQGDGGWRHSVFSQAIHSGTAVHDEPLVFTQRDGQALPVTCTISPIVDDNQVQGATVAFQKVVEPVPPEAVLVQTQIISPSVADVGYRSYTTVRQVQPVAGEDSPDWLSFN